MINKLTLILLDALVSLFESTRCKIDTFTAFRRLQKTQKNLNCFQPRGKTFWIRFKIWITSKPVPLKIPAEENAIKTKPETSLFVRLAIFNGYKCFGKQTNLLLCQLISRIRILMLVSKAQRELCQRTKIDFTARVFVTWSKIIFDSLAVMNFVGLHFKAIWEIVENRWSIYR